MTATEGASQYMGVVEHRTLDPLEEVDAQPMPVVLQQVDRVGAIEKRQRLVLGELQSARPKVYAGPGRGPDAVAARGHVMQAAQILRRPARRARSVATPEPRFSGDEFVPIRVTCQNRHK